MKNSSELLYLAIKERYNTDFYGHQFVGNEVSFPTFYLENTTLHRGGVYLCKTENLPSACSEECIFLCTGEKPTVNFDSWQGSVLHITEKDMNIYNHFLPHFRNYIFPTFEFRGEKLKEFKKDFNFPSIQFIIDVFKKEKNNA